MQPLPGGCPRGVAAGAAGDPLGRRDALVEAAVGWDAGFIEESAERQRRESLPPRPKSVSQEAEQGRQHLSE